MIFLWIFREEAILWQVYRFFLKYKLHYPTRIHKNAIYCVDTNTINKETIVCISHDEWMNYSWYAWYKKNIIALNILAGELEYL